MTFGLAPAACFVDADNPCRGNEVFDKTTYVCGCPAGHALTPDGCVKCGKHEVVTNGACACEDGYAKASADATCTKVEAPPPPPPVSGDGGAGTEPAGSTEPSSDVPQKLSAEGEGELCESSATCAQYPDAKSCSPFGTCSIENCVIDPNNCPDQYLCCDVTAFAPGAPNVCIKDACP